MKRKMFKELNELEKRAKLAKVLLEKTKGGLTKEEIEKIINSVDINIQYRIEVVNDAKEFAEKIILVDNEMEHSWAGTEKTKEIGKLLLGNLNNFNFGTDFKYEYYDNGTLTDENDDYKQPEFDVNEKYAVVIKKHEYSDYNGTYYDYYIYKLIVYIPDKEPYKIDEDLKLIIEKLNIEVKRG